MSNIQNDTQIARFENLLLEDTRDGIGDLLNYIRKSDFYTAPASTRYHSCHEGGLLEHSLNVTECLLQKMNDPKWVDELNKVGHSSVILCGLLHDICKTNYYSVEMKNKKVYCEDGKLHDANGNFRWDSVPSYVVDDKVPYGHGEKSVMMIENFIKLKPAERYAIRWHMGFTEPKENYNALSKAIAMYPLVLALHLADLEATYLMEHEG